jgi:F-type H+-transporting ATPase subunit b
MRAIREMGVRRSEGRRLRLGRTRALCVAAMLGCLVLPAWSAAAGGQPGHDAPPAHAAPAAESGHGSEEAAHGESLWSFLSRIANFAILAGGLYYLLRSPLGRYLDARSQQIRSDLEHAAETRAEAASRLAEIDARLKALPRELEALKARGEAEVAAEGARIRQAAEAERVRLIEQTRREIDRQLQIARRDLTAHAADLAVGVARSRLSRELTEEQQLRLIDRYVAQVETRHE